MKSEKAFFEEVKKEKISGELNYSLMSAI